MIRTRHECSIINGLRQNDRINEIMEELSLCNVTIIHLSTGLDKVFATPIRMTTPQKTPHGTPGMRANRANRVRICTLARIAIFAQKNNIFAIKRLFSTYALDSTKTSLEGFCAFGSERSGKHFLPPNLIGLDIFAYE